MSRTPTHSTTHLGAFQVDSLIATGGMGEVWQGHHRFQSVPVAIKFITGANARNSRYIKAFRREVEATARLRHEGIISVYDYGIVDVEAEKTSNHQLIAGSPYFVMELASHPASELQAPISWGPLRNFLLQILDALSHAHARGVIHRDLKPGNVLFGLDGETPRLTDFGIAQAMAQTLTDVGSHFSGTPAYLAPEQLIGDARDLGPWSDLYSLAAMAYELATGTLPFRSNSLMAMIQAHISKPAPRLESEAYPAAFADWIEILLAKSPAERMRSAADAARALMKCPAPDEDPRFAGPETYQSVDLETASEEHDTVRTTFEVPDARVEPRASVFEPQKKKIAPSETEGEKTPGPRPDQTVPQQTLERGILFSSLSGIEVLSTLDDVVPTHEAPPVPPEWRHHQARLEVNLMGAGLGLYGLRGLPIVGREAERDALWSALHQVYNTGQPFFCAIRGAPGMGASRLAQWLAIRAYELGCAKILRARHEGIANQTQGMGRMMARYLRSVRVRRETARERVAAFLKCGISIGPDVLPPHLRSSDPPGLEEDIDALMGVIDASLKDGGPSTSLSQEGWRIIHEVFQLLARERLIVFWIDDAQWGENALKMAKTIMENADLPVLIVASVNESALRSRGQETAMLEDLLQNGPSTDLRLHPLDTDDRLHLIHQVLGIERELAEEVSRQSGGNPLYAIQLVGDWVQRRLLRSTPDGYSLKSSANGTAPRDLEWLWTERLRSVDEEFGDDAATVHQALELGAALGRQVDTVEWQAICQHAGLQLPLQVLERLEACALVSVGDGAWTFRHEMLRSAIESHARSGGRWRSHHGICAEVLTAMDVSPERLAEHWSEAGERHRAERIRQILSEETRARRERANEDAMQHLQRGQEFETAGDMAAAATSYRQGLAAEADPSVLDQLVLKLAQALAHAREFAQARSVLQRLSNNPPGALSIRALACSLACAAGEQDFDEFDTCYALFSHDSSEATAPAAKDTGRLLELAGICCLKGDDRERANLAFGLALHEYRRLEDRDGLDRIKNRL